jgi:hypothetical protein
MCSLGAHGKLSKRSIEWYDQAFNWPPNENPTEAELKQTVIGIREEGATSAGF